METAAIVAVAIGLLGALVVPLRRLMKPDSTPKPDSSDDDADSDQSEKADSDLAQKYDISYAEGLRSGLKSIRDDLASYGTAIGVASSGLIAAATLTAAKDLFPAPAPQSAVLIVLVLLLSIISIGASAWLTALFFRALNPTEVEILLHQLQEAARCQARESR